jgi:hypothetical protein
MQQNYTSLSERSEFIVTRVLDGFKAFLVVPFVSVVKWVAKLLSNLIIYLSRTLISMTGGGAPYLSGDEGPQHTFLHFLILLSFGNSARQWGIALTTVLGISVGGTGYLPAFALGALVSCFTQIVQARAIRGDEPVSRRAAANDAMRHKEIDESAYANAIEIGKIKAREYNNAGMLTHRILGAVGLATWGVELWAMGVTTAWPTAWFSLAMLAGIGSCVLQAFSTELLIKLETQVK